MIWIKIIKRTATPTSVSPPDTYFIQYDSLSYYSPPSPPEVWVGQHLYPPLTHMSYNMIVYHITVPPSPPEVWVGRTVKVVIGTIIQYFYVEWGNTN